MKYADLHNHTTASDGLYTPTQLVYHAKCNGLDAIGVTDHDTTNGLDEAKIAGERFGIEIIPGIELNTQMNGIEIHILGYFIDYKVPWFQDLLRTIRDARNNRAQKMVYNLVNMYGMDLDFDEIKSRAGGRENIGRPHIARAMIDKGIVKDIAEAFEKYIGEGCKAYVERYKITVTEGIELIKRVGGVPVLAHPGIIRDERIVNEIIPCGIVGIEAYHSKHTFQQRDSYVKLAKAEDLIVTGGSDCHGDGNPMVGDVRISYENVCQLREIAKST